LIIQVFQCSMCTASVERPDNADKDFDHELSVVMKVHDQKHDYHNEWLATKEGKYQ